MFLALVFLAFFLLQRETASKGLAQHQTARALAFFSRFPDLGQLSESGRALTLVLGQSELEISFDPRIFDSLTAGSATPTKSYNLAVRFMSPELYSVFAKIYRSRGGPRARFIFYNLPVFALTSGYARTMGPQLGHLPLLLEWARSAPFTEFASGLFLSSLRDMLTIQSVERGAIIRLSPARLLPGEQERGRLFDSYVSYWADPNHNDVSPWRKESGGLYEFRTTAEESAFYQKEFRNPLMRQAIASAYEACCNLLTLDISPPRLDALVRTNADLLEIGEQVVFLELPEAPSLRKRRNPVAVARLEQAAALLREKGLKIWKVDAGFSEEDYSDGIHFSASGAEKLHRWLAARVVAP